MGLARWRHEADPVSAALELWANWQRQELEARGFRRVDKPGKPHYIGPRGVIKA